MKKQTLKLTVSASAAKIGILESPWQQFILKVTYDALLEQITVGLQATQNHS